MPSFRQFHSPDGLSLTGQGMRVDPTPLPDVADGASVARDMRPALVRYFKRRSGSAAEAEDLAHDVIAQTLGQALQATAGELRGYIFRAAANRWRDRLRRHRARSMVVSWGEGDFDPPAEQITPERALSAEQELIVVTQALLELDERTRNVLILVRLEHMKIGSVAQMLGISRSAVNRLLSKAIAHVHAKDEAREDRK